jgi:hypothetical protein
MSSPNNTVVQSGSGGLITDASGNKWTISLMQFVVLENGHPAAYTANVAEIAYVHDVIWHKNISGQWYSWNGLDWISGNNPLPPQQTAQILILMTVQEILAALITTQTTVNKIMSATTAVQTDLASMQVSLATIATDITGISTMLGNINTGGLSAADQASMDSVTQSLASVATQLTAMATPAVTPAPAPTPDPNAP